MFSVIVTLIDVTKTNLYFYFQINKWSPSCSVSNTSFSEHDGISCSNSDDCSALSISPSLSPDYYSPQEGRSPMFWTVDDVYQYISSLPGQLHFSLLCEILLLKSNKTSIAMAVPLLEMMCCCYFF